jgi:hypothetical protein
MVNQLYDVPKLVRNRFDPGTESRSSGAARSDDRYSLWLAGIDDQHARSSEPVRSCNPRLGRFDSGAAPSFVGTAELESDVARRPGHPMSPVLAAANPT